MLALVMSACPWGVGAVPVTVEVDVRGERLKISIVGLPDAATKESKDRLVPAINNSGYAVTNEEIVINLSPADLPKEGTAYDLPMAVGILAAKGILPSQSLEDSLFLGELALDGSLRPVRSVLASTECALEHGLRRIYVPRGNGWEASLIAGIEIHESPDLRALVNHLRGNHPLPSYQGTGLPLGQGGLRNDGPLPDLGEVKGQYVAKRVLEIAAAGAHNLLFYGPPGSGKSMLSKRLPGILPEISPAEILEVTRIYSCAGRLSHDRRAILDRPFRAPHHTASPAAMIGGGSKPKPGEVTLAHRGVLFLDEFPEFPRMVLEVLRQPLEDGHVTVSRAERQVTFPANFILVAAMNPCPCGHLGDNKRRCTCTQNAINNYRARLSGPLLDRIDLQLEVPNISLRGLRKQPASEPSAKVKARVETARAVQERRLASTSRCNADLTPAEIAEHCRLPGPLAEMLETRIDQLGYSSRVHGKVLKVARTIADLEGTVDIAEAHLLEALGYRQLDKRRHTAAHQEVGP